MKRARRHGCDWTREEDALLAREWGDISGELLGAKLGRSEIACVRRARELGLPLATESAGRESIKSLGRRLGMSGQAVQRLMRDCGWTVRPLAPATESTKRRWPKRGADRSTAEALCALRTTRVCSLWQWDKAGGSSHAAVRLLTAAGLQRPARRGVALRVPVALLEELAAGVRSGPQATLWRRVTSAEALPCAAWVLALATWDILHNVDDAAGWTEWAIPPAVINAARGLAGLRGATCAGRGEERAA